MECELFYVVGCPRCVVGNTAHVYSVVVHWYVLCTYWYSGTGTCSVLTGTPVLVRALYLLVLWYWYVLCSYCVTAG